MKKFTFIFLLTSYVLSFGLKAQVINENFDASSSLPDGWSALTNSTTAKSTVKVYTYSGYSPKNCVKYTANSGDIDLFLSLISPQIDYTQNLKYKVSFQLKSYSAGDQIELGIVTDPEDQSTYEAIETFELQSAYTYYLFETYIAPNKIGNLVFKHIKGTLFIDDVLVEKVLPYNVLIEKISGVESMPGNTTAEYKYLVKNNGLNDATINLELTSDLASEIKDKSGENTISSIVLNGLTQDTIIAKVTTAAIQTGIKEETISLKGSVSEGSDISSSVILTINTYATYKNIDENFDAAEQLPVNWQVLTNSSTGKSSIIVKKQTSTSTPNSVKYTASSSDQELFLALVTPQFDFTEQNQYKVSLELYSNRTGDQIELGTLSDPTDPTSFESLEILDVVKGYNYSLIETYVSVNKLAYLAFKHVKGAIIIDDVKVEPVLPYNVFVESLSFNDAIASEESFEYAFIVKNTGATDAVMNLSVVSELTNQIKDKTGESDISSISLKALMQDTIIVKVTSSIIESGIKDENFIVKAVISESTDIISSNETEFKTYTPFTEIEEGFEAENKPFAWNAVGVVEKLKFYQSASNAHTGLGYVQIGSLKDKETMLISPMIKGFDGDYRFSAWFKETGPVEIGKITDLNDWSTYSVIKSDITGGYSYKEINVVCPDFKEDAYLVIKYVGTSNYAKVIFDDIDIERYRDVEVDLRTENTECKSYFGKHVNYPIYVQNKGKLEGTFNININSSWAYKILAKDLSTEITQITVLNDELDTLYIQVQIPETDIISGTSQVADVKISVNSDADNFEEILFTTIAYAPITYLKEGFEGSRELPLNWMAYTSKLYSSESSVKVTTGTVYEGENCVYISHKSGLKRPTFLVTPVIKASEEAYTFSFYARAFNTTMNAEIGYFTDPNDTTTYHSIKTVECINEHIQFVIEDIVLTESAALTISTSSAGALYMDNFLIEQVKTNVDFSVNEGAELSVVNPELFVSFSKPVQGNGNIELTNDNIAKYIELREESLTGQIVAVNYDISDNMQMIKIAAVKDLDGITYHLIVNDQLIDINGLAVEKTSVSFTVKDDILPVFVDGYPVTENVSETSFDIKLQSTENSTVFYLLVADDATAPSANEIIASVNYGSVSVVKGANEELVAKTNTILTVDELEGKVYDLYLTLKDRAGNIQTEVTKLDVELLDLTAPEFTEGFPVVENITKNTFDLSVKSNEDGKSYYILVADGSEVPDYQQVKAGVDYNSETVIVAGNKNILGNTTEILLVEGLDENTEYDLYVILEDNNGNTQENVVKLDVKTLDVTAPEFVEGFPNIENITKDAFDLSVKSNEDGKSYYILVADGSETPSYQQVIDGVDYNSITVVVGDNKSINGNVEEHIQVVGLDENTSYDLYVTLDDNSGNIQEPVVKLDVKTLDITAPEFAEGFPVVENIMKNSLDLKVKSNEDGKSYYILVADGSDAPNYQQVIDGVDYNSIIVVVGKNKSINGNVEEHIQVVGLDENTSYDLYVTLDDNSGNIQEAVVKLDVKTLDVTAPEFAANYPMVDAVKENGFDIKVKSLEEGTAYFIVVAKTSAAPVANEIKNGSDYGSVTVLTAGNIESKTNEETLVSITDLSSNTEYVLYLTIEDEDNNLQETISKIEVKTLGSTSIENVELEIEFYPNPATDYIKINTIENIETYTLLNSIGNVVRSGNGSSKTIKVNNLNSGVYFIIVKTISGKEKVEKIMIK